MKLPAYTMQSMSAIRHNRIPVDGDLSTSPKAAAEGGFALITAIFLLVILAALGGFMLTLSTVQHTTSTQDLQGERAYQAARAGIEWGLYQAMKPEHTNLPTGQSPYVCPAGPVPLNNLAGTLTGFSVQLQCTSTLYTEGQSQIGVIQFTSSASLGTSGSAQYVARQISASIGTCRTASAPCVD